MKHLANAVQKIAIFTIAAGFLWLWLAQRQKPEAVKALEEAQRLEWMRVWHDAVIFVTWIGAVALAILALAIVAFVVVKVRNMSQRIYAKEGLYPIIRQDTGTLLDTLRGNTQQTFVNANLLASPTGTMVVKRNGATDLHTGANGYTDQQLIGMHTRQQGVQYAQTKARQKQLSKWEVLRDEGLLEQTLPQRRVEALPAPEEVVDVTPVKLLTVDDAMNQSRANGFVLGQNETTGKLCIVDPKTSVNMAILGVTGCGKTASSGFHLATTALAKGYQLLILDGKGGMDWQPFAGVTEWHDADGAVFSHGMEVVLQEYRRRMELAKRYQVKHIADLADPAYPPILVIVEEYGSLYDSLARAKRAEVDGVLNELGRKGRATDIHFCLIDQYPEKWTPVTMGATKAKLLYKQGPNQGQKVGDYAVANLPDVGYFRHNGETFHSWHVEPVLDQFIGQIRKWQHGGKLARYPQVIDGSYTVGNSVSSAGTRQETGAGTGNTLQERAGAVSSQEALYRGVYRAQNGTVDTPTRNTGNTVSYDVRGLTEVQRMILRHIQKDPTMGVRDRAEVLNVSPGYVSKVQRFMSGQDTEQ